MIMNREEEITPFVIQEIRIKKHYNGTITKTVIPEALPYDHEQFGIRRDITVTLKEAKDKE